MSTSSDFSVGQTHQFIVTFAKAGGEPKDLTVLTQSESKCAEVLSFLRDQNKLEPTKLVIDCDAYPYTGYKVLVPRHDKHGLLNFKPAEVELYLTPEQLQGEKIQGHEWLERLRKLEGKTLLNANVLDWLIKKENQRYIPDDWRKYEVIFPGTEFTGTLFSRFVRSLRWHHGGWRCRDRYLYDSWDIRHHAAIIASSEAN